MLYMKLPKINSSRIWDAVNFGAGLTLGYIIVNGLLGLTNKYAGGIIPPEFSANRGRVTFYANGAWSYCAGDTSNTVKYE